MVLVDKMKKYEGKEKHPSLYDEFELGDRVKRIYRDGSGTKEFKGIVLAIDKQSIEIYWDTVDGKYRPKNMDIAFTNCSLEEIFNGIGKFSRIEKERGY